MVGHTEQGCLFSLENNLQPPSKVSVPGETLQAIYTEKRIQQLSRAASVAVAWYCIFSATLFFPRIFFFKSQILLILKVTWCFRYHLHSRVHMSLCENLLTHILVISGYYIWKSWGRQACIHCLNPNVPFYFYNWECCLTWSSLFLSVKITKQRIIGRTKYVGRKEVYHIL